MTDTPPKPKRRRWRWLVVEGLLAIVMCRIWWWPQTDPRLVGTWSVAAAGDKKGPYATYVFRANGVLEDRTLGEEPVVLHWSTTGDELFISSRIPGPLLRTYTRMFEGRSSEVEHLFLKPLDADHFTMGHARKFDYDIEMTRLSE